MWPRRALIILFSVILSENFALSEQCSGNQDCETAFMICKDKTCQCNDISYANGDRCLQYVTEYKGYCEEDEQCSGFLGANSVCRRSECICADGHTWVNGKCQNYSRKGEKCDKDKICYDENDMRSLTCDSSGTCVCNGGYQDRGPDCRVQSSSCVLNWDCENKQECVKGICVKSKNDNPPNLALKTAIERNLELYKSMLLNKFGNQSSFLAEDRTIRNMQLDVGSSDVFPDCDVDSNCSSIANSKCDSASTKCSCVENHFFNNGNCIPGFQACSSDLDCSKIKNSICFKQATCICKPGFFEKDGKCIAELGVVDEEQNSVEDCAILPAEFADNTCYCGYRWFPSDDKRSCIKTSTQEFQNCMANSWCNVMGPYSYCEDMKCKCSSFSKLNKDIYYCEKTSEPNATCLRDYDCNANEYCSGEECRCLDGFVKNEESGECLPDQGTSCSHLTCNGEYLCVGGVCGCTTENVPYDGKCWKVADHLSDSCEQKEQCRKLEHTDCLQVSDNSTEKTCWCIEGYTAVDDICLQSKAFGDPCMKETDCTLVINTSLQCRNSICQCPLGETMSNGYCERSAALKELPHLGILILLCIVSRLS